MFVICVLDKRLKLCLFVVLNFHKSVTETWSRVISLTYPTGNRWRQMIKTYQFLWATGLSSFAKILLATLSNQILKLFTLKTSVSVKLTTIVLISKFVPEKNNRLAINILKCVRNFLLQSRRITFKHGWFVSTFLRKTSRIWTKINIMTFFKNKESKSSFWTLVHVLVLSISYEIYLITSESGTFLREKHFLQLK